jgi:hypothetical protein
MDFRRLDDHHDLKILIWLAQWDVDVEHAILTRAFGDAQR